MRIFVDTGAFIAMTDKDDANHNKAALFYKTMKEKGVRFATSNFVVCETMNYLRAKVSHNIAVVFRDNLTKSGFFEIITVTSFVEDTAFGIFRQYADKGFSFTDCMSFALMKSQKIKKSFAFDRHFDQYDNFMRLP
jgi:uncharacterized protein